MINYISKSSNKILAKILTSNDNFNKFTDIKKKPCLDKIFADDYCENLYIMTQLSHELKTYLQNYFLHRKEGATIAL